MDESITASLPTTNLEEPLLSSSEGEPPEDSCGSTTATTTAAPPQDNTSTPAENNNSNNVTFSCCSKSYSINQNVLLTFILDASYGVSESLWAGTVFAAYLKRLGRNQNGPVGDIEAINGLAVLCSALPVGYLADRYGRSIVIRAGGILFLLTTVLHVGVMEWIAAAARLSDDDDNDDNDDNNTMLPMILLGIVMGLWGIGGGVVSGPCQALYADSTPAGERSKYYQYLFVVYLLASCVGPLISIVLFQYMNDDNGGDDELWSMSTLRTIIYVGLGLEFLNAGIMMFFDDSKALDEGDNEEEEEEEETTPLNQPQLGVDEEEIFQDENEHEGNNFDDAQTVVAANTRLKKRQRWIPYILFVSSVIMSIGSGMTVKFFPLFFKDEVGMSPTQVQIVYVLVPIVMSLLSGVGTWIAAGFGRVQTSLLLQFAGIACLFGMVFGKTYLDNHPLVLVPVYVLRTALMNAPYPLQESILMDFVPKTERARWKSLESISQFGWCGSAALGGYLSDKMDYSFTFFITALIQTVGTLVFALLLPLVPKQESISMQQEEEEAAASGSSGSSAEQQQQQQDVIIEE